MWVILSSQIMYRINIKKATINLSPLRLHSATSVHIPNSGNKLFNSVTVPITPLKLHSATSFSLPSVNISNCFHNVPKVTLSRLPNSLIRKHKLNDSFNLSRKGRMYPLISKCNAKRCKCCNYLSCRSTIKSSVNGRQFSVEIPCDID